MSAVPYSGSRFEPGERCTTLVDAKDYPALFRAADAYSLVQQTRFYCALRAELFLLVLAAAMAVYGPVQPLWAASQAMVVLLALACAIFLFSTKPDRHWYSSRAVAESVKTVTWRFVTRAEPFDGEEAKARQLFRETLDDIVKQNRDVARQFNSDLDGIQLTDAMYALRRSEVGTRKAAYLKGRVLDQQNWYASKNRSNHRNSKRVFIAVSVVLVLAVFAAVLRVEYVEATMWPTDIFVALASALVAWSQAKRFTELAAAYSLAAVEISGIRLQGEEVQSEEGLSRFVSDAENAFSREHTQWAARKDG